MKYYSEIIDELFDTQEELDVAEKKYQEVVDKEKEDEISKSKAKKECANKIAECKKAIDDAIDNLNKAQENANKIVDEAKKKAREIYNEAKSVVIECENAKKEAIREFNEKFGTYSEYYTGKDAETEFEKLIKSLSIPSFSVWGNVIDLNDIFKKLL